MWCFSCTLSIIIEKLWISLDWNFHNMGRFFIDKFKLIIRNQFQNLILKIDIIQPYLEGGRVQV